MRSRRVVLGTLALALLTACGSSTTAAGGGSVAPPPSSDLFAPGTFTIGSDVSYPPQEYFDPPGSTTIVGFDIDVGKALAAKMGLKFNVVNNSFDSIIASLSGKKFDAIMSAMTINDERKKTVAFVPYFNAGEAFIVEKGSSAHPTQLTDLCGQTVAVEKGTSEESEVADTNNPAKQGKCASNPIKSSSYDTDTEALQQLAKGTVSIHFTDSPVAGYEVKHNSAVVQSGPVIETAPEGIGLRLDDSAMVKAVTDAFKAIEADGTYDNLLKKWGLADGDIRKA